MSKMPAEIALAVKALNKQFGKEMITMGPTKENPEVFSTGSVNLDAGLDIGGLPCGRIVEIFGQEHSGKTSLSLWLMKKWIDYQVSKGKAREDIFTGYVDMERTTTGAFIKSFGLIQENLLWAPVDTAEQALETIKTWAAVGVGFIILDSVDAIQTEKQIQAEIGDSKVAGASKLMSEALRKLVKDCDANNVTVIFINQVRDKMPQNGMPGGKTTPGGKALPFYSSVRLELYKRGESDYPRAFKLRIHIKKNKCSLLQDREIAVDFINGRGILEAADIIEGLKLTGTGAFAGPSFQVRWTPDGDKETVSSGGKLGAIQTLSEDLDLQARLRTLALQRLQELAN